MYILCSCIALIIIVKLIDNLQNLSDILENSLDKREIFVYNSHPISEERQEVLKEIMIFKNRRLIRSNFYKPNIE